MINGDNNFSAGNYVVTAGIVDHFMVAVAGPFDYPFKNSLPPSIANHQYTWPGLSRLDRVADNWNQPADMAAGVFGRGNYSPLLPCNMRSPEPILCGAFLAERHRSPPNVDAMNRVIDCPISPTG
jgi:hypothetical protein